MCLFVPLAWYSLFVLKKAIKHQSTDLTNNDVQETLIVWSEGDNCDYALSFQEKKGCDEVWEKICQVCILTILQHIESAGMTWQWYCVY